MAQFWEQWYKDHPYMLPHQDRQEYHIQGKLTFKPTDDIKVLLSGFRARVQHGRYGIRGYDSPSNDWKYRLDHYRADFRRQTQVSGGITHLVSPSFFYDLRFGYFQQDRQIGVRDEEAWEEKDWLDQFFSDIPLIDPGREGNSPLLEQDYSGPANPWLAENYYLTTEGDYRYFQTRREITYTAKGDATWQATKNHTIKSGVELRIFDLDYFDITDPWREDPWIAFFGDDPAILGSAADDTMAQVIKPRQIAAYVQDKMEFEGLVINAGVRFDYLSANAFFLAPAFTDTTQLVDLNDVIRTDAEPKFQVSPRLGIAFPVSETQSLHFSYGYFFQVPPMLYLFDGLNMTPQFIGSRGNTIVGNPDMEAEKTISYEAGISTQLATDMAFDVTAFYKDVYNWPGLRVVSALPGSYYAYINADWGNVKGLEFTFRKRGTPVSATFSYTLQFAEGTGTDVYDYYRQDYYFNLPTPKKVYPLDYDQRHQLSVNLSYSVIHGAGPSFGSFFPLEDSYISAIFQAHSGEPYSPRNARGELVGELNSQRMPWWMNIDLRAKKDIKIGPVQLSVVGEIFNVLNRKNIEDVFMRSGRPDDSGLLQGVDVSDFNYSDAQADLYRVGGTFYDPRQDLNGDGTVTPQERYDTFVMFAQDYMHDPLNYGSPRQFRLGLELNF
jgi:hypothetical protein